MDSIQVNNVTYWLPENSSDVMQRQSGKELHR